MLTAFWPQRWSRQQRSNATLVSAVILMVLALALLGQLLSFLPEPIGSNAQAFSDGARTTLWLTLISGSVGLALGTGAALARTARWAALRWPALAGRYRRLVLLAIAWTLAEWLRGHVFTGYAWNPLAHVWAFATPLLQGAALFGVYGLGLLTFMILAAPADAVEIDSYGRAMAMARGLRRG